MSILGYGEQNLQPALDGMVHVHGFTPLMDTVLVYNDDKHQFPNR